MKPLFFQGRTSVCFLELGDAESLNPPFSLVPEYGEDLLSLQEGENTKPLKICDGPSPPWL